MTSDQKIKILQRLAELESENERLRKALEQAIEIARLERKIDRGGFPFIVTEFRLGNCFTNAPELDAYLRGKE